MEHDAFDRTLVDAAGYLPGYFRRRVADAQTVEDLTQETLLKGLRARATLREQTRVRSWIFGIAHCTLVDYYRRRQAVVADRDGPWLEGGFVDQDVREVLVSSARCYLETLPREYRDAVHLAEYEGVAHHRVAQRLGVSLAAAKTRVRRGKLMVRKLMEAQCQFEYDGVGNIIGYQVRARPSTVQASR